MSPPRTKPKKAPHRFAILILTIANLKREDEYSLEVDIFPANFTFGKIYAQGQA